MFVKKHVLASGTSFAAPYYVIKGKLPGPVFMVVSGIHGNETGSIRAAQELVNHLNQGRLFIDCGTLIIIPKINKEAYRKRIRGVPDLNRAFPRKRNTHAHHPLAAALFQLAQRYQPLWYLDLHEANGLSQRNPKRLGQTLIVNSKSRGLGTVKEVIKSMNRSISVQSHRFNIRIRELPGSSRTAAARILRAKAVTVETCWSLERSIRIKYQMDIVCLFLKTAGLMESSYEKRPRTSPNYF